MNAAASKVDTGWAWVVCAAGCVIHIFIIGHVRCTGILLAATSEHFGSSKRDTSWIMGISFLLFLSLTPITMSVAKRVSVRLVTLVGSLCLCCSFSLSYFATSLEFLYVTTGALTGLGLSLLHPPTLLLVNLYFDRRRTVATGITLAGCSIGALCMPPLIGFLFEKFSFRGGLLLWGGVMLHTAIACMMLRPFVASKSPAFAPSSDLEAEDEEQLEAVEIGKDEQKQQKQLVAPEPSEAAGSGLLAMASCGDVSALPQGSMSERRSLHRALLLPHGQFRRKLQRVRQALGLLRNPRFWLLAVALSFATEGLPLNFFMVPQHAEQLGMHRSRSTLLIQMQGITDFFTRISIGFAIDHQLIRLSLLMWLMTFTQSGLWLLLLLPAMQTFAGLMAFVLLEGVVGGVLMTLLAPCLVQAFGVDSLPTSYGVSGIVESLVMLLVPALLGEVRDRTGQWLMSFVTFSCLLGASGLMLMVDDLILRPCYRKRQMHTVVVE